MTGRATGVQSTLCKHLEEHYSQRYVHNQHQHDQLLAREPILRWRRIRMKEKERERVSVVVTRSKGLLLWLHNITIKLILFLYTDDEEMFCLFTI